MKALFVSNDPTVFDAASAARARMRAYASAIGELHFVSAGPPGAVEETDGALTLHRLVGGRLATLLALPGRARRIIEAHGIEVVSAQDPFEHGWAAKKAARGTNAKLHLQVHTDFLSPWFTRDGVFRSMRVKAPALNRFRQWLADRVLPGADGIRAASRRVADSLVARYGSRIPAPAVIPIAVPASLPEALPLPPHPFGFAFVTAGRLEPEKRIEDILMSIGRLGPRYQQVGLVVIGQGSERKRLEALAASLGLSSRVLFLGEQGTNAPAYMRSGSAYIQASAYEGYGRTLIEAALARLPIITTDVGIVGEVFKGYESVLSTPPGDTANLAAHMTALIGDQALRRTLAMNAEVAAKAHLASLVDQPRMVADDLARTRPKG